MPGVNDWVAKATGDLKATRKLVKDDDDTLDVASYHCQQVAEKALKAYLVFKQQQVPRTHDLEKLLLNVSSIIEIYNLVVIISYKGARPELVEGNGRI